jgi:trehalose/maltose hydrolase-like predicted phosphorylase
MMMSSPAQETWMYPPLLLMQPDLARSLIQYRHDRLPAAEAKAQAYKPPDQNAGLEGAMFPWCAS